MKKRLKSPQFIAQSTNLNIAGFTKKRVHTENAKEKRRDDQT